MFKALGYYTVTIGKVFDDRNVVVEDQASGCWSEYPYFSQTNTRCFDVPMPACQAPWDPTECKCVVSPGVTSLKGRVPSIQNGPLNGSAYVDARMGDFAAQKLRSLMARPAGSPPFLLMVGLYKPHLPFAAPTRWFNLFNLAKIPLPAWPQLPTGPLPARLRSSD
jgi:hypothetical protein